ncbi:dimethyl sulfoxide reductase anchor subunit family protein [Providencia rettgeri]|uniref:dimethyl sulfoxide reductase anchor subunit family protein n=1 Tax=Providencia rettgeri TaxID=587 RepID=UPI0025520B01|nr:DmsC/YnfH family molybdoenzyme membrane anchor subunit [Providencia rettgeri]MDK7744895.1 dimethyl sulfoxide reductase anchor subunit [Providencia rettgeri]MDK7758767.1 dimethyl sulfoxide reductase anchor subunit [Providencia rettgeri]
MHELPLVFFTVFTQSAVGAFIILQISGALGHINERRKAIGLFVMVCFFGLGAVIGIFHIGQPLRAINMLFRVGLSPMSNEIILSAVFGALGGVSALGLLLKRNAKVTYNTIAWLSAAVGLIFLFAIPQVYQLPTVVTWSSSYTTVIMMLTPLIGGGTLAALFGAHRLGLLVSIMAILVSFSIRPGYLSMLMDANVALTTAQNSCFIVQSALLAAGVAAAIGYILLKSEKIIFMVAAVVLMAELVGRIAFYNLWSLPM